MDPTGCPVRGSISLRDVVFLFWVCALLALLWLISKYVNGPATWRGCDDRERDRGRHQAVRHVRRGPPLRGGAHLLRRPEVEGWGQGRTGARPAHNRQQGERRCAQ